MLSWAAGVIPIGGAGANNNAIDGNTDGGNLLGSATVFRRSINSKPDVLTRDFVGVAASREASGRVIRQSIRRDASPVT